MLSLQIVQAAVKQVGVANVKYFQTGEPLTRSMLLAAAFTIRVCYFGNSLSTC